MKLACPATDVSNVTGGPEVWLHTYVSGSESESLLAVPSNVTRVFAPTLASAPAEAVGGAFAIVTDTADGAEESWPSLTVNEKDSVPDIPGAVNAGLAEVGLLRTTVVPAVCVHA